MNVEGDLPTKYQAGPIDQGISFIKLRTSRIQEYVKIVLVCHNTGEKE